MHIVAGLGFAASLAWGIALPATAAEADPLAGTRWMLQAQDDRRPVEDRPAATLDFDASGRISGTDGCNAFQGQYTVAGDRIRIGPHLAGTLMACPQAQETRARAFREALQRAAQFRRDGHALELHDDRGQSLARLTAAAVSPVGGSWAVVSYNNGKGGVVSVLGDTRITAAFGADGRLSGNSGCNRYFARFRLAEQRIAIAPPAGTRRACPEPAGLMEQEALYFGALETAASFQMAGDALELRTASGALAVRFTRVGN
jgi:heat shock protein HslJ